MKALWDKYKVIIIAIISTILITATQKAISYFKINYTKLDTTIIKHR